MELKPLLGHIHIIPSLQAEILQIQLIVYLLNIFSLVEEEVEDQVLLEVVELVVFLQGLVL